MSIESAMNEYPKDAKSIDLLQENVKHSRVSLFDLSFFSKFFNSIHFY
jgi:hypothetical protein